MTVTRRPRLSSLLDMMNVALWVLQILLAALYAVKGLWKIKGQAAVLEITMPGIPLPLTRGVGLIEILAGSALVLPAVAPQWTHAAGWAGACLAAEAAAFVVYRLWNSAFMRAGVSMLLGLLAALVAWGRLGS